MRKFQRAIDGSNSETVLEKFRQEVGGNRAYYEEQSRQFHLEMLKSLNKKLNKRVYHQVGEDSENAWRTIENVLAFSLPGRLDDAEV